MYPIELYDMNPDHYSTTSSDFTPTATPEPEETNDRLDKRDGLDVVKPSCGFYVDAKLKFKSHLFMDDIPIYKPEVNAKKDAHRCPICHKTFSRPSALNSHSFIHSGERPYQCTSAGCFSRFTVESNLRRHYKVHQKKTSTVKKMSPEERIRCVLQLMSISKGDSRRKENQSSHFRSLIPIHHLSNKSMTNHYTVTLDQKMKKSLDNQFFKTFYSL